MVTCFTTAIFNIEAESCLTLDKEKKNKEKKKNKHGRKYWNMSLFKDGASGVSMGKNQILPRLLESKKKNVVTMHLSETIKPP